MLRFIQFRFERVCHFCLIFIYLISLQAFDLLSSKRDLAVPKLIKGSVYLALKHTQSFLWVPRIPVASPSMSQTQKRGNELFSKVITRGYLSPNRRKKTFCLIICFSHWRPQLCYLSLIQWKIFSLHPTGPSAALDPGPLSPWNNVLLLHL